MLIDAFGPGAIAISHESLSWEQALARAVGLLQVSDRVNREYLSQVLLANNQHGPYFVVAPGIAIAHAAPSDAVLATGFALLKLENPVTSGSSNDPVRLLFAFAAVDSQSHLALLSEFAQVMSRPESVNILLNESDPGAIRNFLAE